MLVKIFRTRFPKKITRFIYFYIFSLRITISILSIVSVSQNLLWKFFLRVNQTLSSVPFLKIRLSSGLQNQSNQPTLQIILAKRGADSFNNGKVRLLQYHSLLTSTRARSPPNDAVDLRISAPHASCTSKASSIEISQVGWCHIGPLEEWRGGSMVGCTSS